MLAASDAHNDLSGRRPAEKPGHSSRLSALRALYGSAALNLVRSRVEAGAHVVDRLEPSLRKRCDEHGSDEEQDEHDDADDDAGDSRPVLMTGLPRLVEGDDADNQANDIEEEGKNKPDDPQCSAWIFPRRYV